MEIELTDIEQMELVKFKDGKFGIRKGEEYLDLKTKSHFWKPRSSYFKDCRGDEDNVRAALKSYMCIIELSKDLGEVAE
jgi:hypothetical protein